MARDGLTKTKDLLPKTPTRLMELEEELLEGNKVAQLEELPSQCPDPRLGTKLVVHQELAMLEPAPKAKPQSLKCLTVRLS